MPTRKIADELERHCTHHDHNPPSMQVFEPGLYEHECPACHRKVTFRVKGSYLDIDDRNPMHSFGYGGSDD